MLATQEAMQLAAMADKWEAHPSRAEQRIAWVHGVEHMWPECAVPLNACVIRFWNKKKKCTDYIVLVTTDLKLRASWMVRHYEERPEIEQDDEQMKSGGWQLKKLSSTRYSEIVFYVLTVVLSYSLYHLFANTKRGHDLPTRRARQWPLSNCVPNARISSCTLGVTLKSLRPCASSRWCCNCPHLCKSTHVRGWQSISIKFRSGNDLSATEI